MKLSRNIRRVRTGGWISTRRPKIQTRYWSHREARGTHCGTALMPLNLMCPMTLRDTTYLFTWYVRERARLRHNNARKCDKGCEWRSYVCDIQIARDASSLYVERNYFSLCLYAFYNSSTPSFYNSSSSLNTIPRERKSIADRWGPR